MLERDIIFLHAYSAAQARTILQEEPDLALILLDVVMESASAGLDLVHYIREELKRDEVRIILRTGQPGYAPEIDTIRRLDINDYKTKDELTRVRLYTSLTVGLRSYQQLKNLQRNRLGLQLIVSGGTELSKMRGLRTFCDGVVTQISALINVPTEGLICAQSAPDGQDDSRVIAAAGRYRELINMPLAQLDDQEARDALQKCLAERVSQIGTHCCLYFGTTSGRGMAAYISTCGVLGTLEADLLEVFCSSISVGLENVLLYSQLVDYAYTDQLLRLPNRLRLVELISQHFAKPDGITLALVDIDDFAGVNSTMGNSFGDALLHSVSYRLTGLCEGRCSLARVAGDIFGIVGPQDIVNPEVLLAAFELPFQVEGQGLRISASIGLINLASSPHNASEVLKDCHLALKQSKLKSRGSAHFFSQEMSFHAKERVRLLHALREAFTEQRLFVVYQPQVSMADGQPIGAEALIRWRQDNGSFVPPDRFIPLAEQAGLIIALGEFVLRTALHQLKRLHDLGYGLLRMSINASRLQLIEPNFVKTLQAAMAEANVAASQVEIEITESSAMDNVELMMSVLAAMRATGVSVAIDDFGTGYSSLSALRQLGVNKLKIDKAFVDNLGESPDEEVIAQTVIDLSRSLRMAVIAEGVETTLQQDRLLAMGCQQGQGYLYARPMPADQFEAWLKQAPGTQP